MKKITAPALHVLLIAAMFAVAFWAIRELPPGGQVAIHWGPDGQPDAWVGEWAGLLIIPISACVLRFLMSWKPMPPGGGRRPALTHVFLVQLAAQLLLAIDALGSAFDTSSYIAITLGALYIAMGVRERSAPARRWIFGLCGLGIVLAAFGLRPHDRIVGVFVLALAAPSLTMLQAWLAARRPRR